MSSPLAQGCMGRPAGGGGLDTHPSEVKASHPLGMWKEFLDLRFGAAEKMGKRAGHPLAITFPGFAISSLGLAQSYGGGGDLLVDRGGGQHRVNGQLCGSAGDEVIRGVVVGLRLRAWW